MAANIARHAWFERHRRSICGDHALVRAIESPSAVIWRLVPSGSSLRPLPGSAADAPERLQELFGGVHALARDRNLVLCVDPEASLTAASMRWLSDELDALFSTLSPRAFQSPALSRLLADVLAVAHLPAGSDGSDLRETIGRHVRRALCDALHDTDSSLAHSEQVRTILSHAPRDLFLPLPKSVEHRRLLQALASTRSSVLPVRHEWLVAAAAPGSSLANDRPALLRTDLAALLCALEPIITCGEQPDLADQAAAAALECLRRQNLLELSGLDDFADLAILRGRDSGTDEQVVLTLKESCECSRKGLLFRAAPTAKVLLRKLARALPDVHPIIVSGKTAELLAEQGGSALRLITADKRTCLDLVDAASRFGNDTDRAELIDALQVASGDDRTALRKLCAGKPEAGMPAARLAATDGLSSPMESIAARCVADDGSMFLVPRRIADALSLNQRDYIGVGTLDNRGIEVLLKRNANALLDPRLTETERDAILQTDISDSALKALPIHVRSDGTVGNTEGVFLETEAWPIPRALARLPQLGVVSDENHGFWLPARPGVPAKPGGSEFVACQNPV